MRALLLLLAAAVPTGTSSPGPRPAPDGPWTAVHWREGAVERTGWVDPLTLAELRPDEAGARAVKALDAGAAARCPRPGVCLWSVRDARAALSTLPRERFVPVLRDERSTAAPMRVAVGGVVVALEGRRAAGERAAWFTARRLEVVRWLDGDLALVATGPGEDAVALAERLSAEDGVELAVPNWWRPGALR